MDREIIKVEPGFVEASYGWIFLHSENIEKAIECI
jgi:hypothetical protein